MTNRLYRAQAQLERLFDRAADHPTVTIAGSTITLPAERRFGDIASVQVYVDAVLGLAPVRQHWPVTASRPVRVRDRRGTGRAHYEYDGAVLAIPTVGGESRWARREIVVLHEIAHHLGNTGADPDTGHGDSFADRLLTLLRIVVGPEAEFALRVLLADQAGVGVPKPQAGR